MRQFMKALLISLVAALALSGCTKAAGEAADKNNSGDVIKIGVFEPLTGENGKGGQQEVKAIQYANEIYPEVLGKKVELIIVDNKSDKNEAVKAVKKLIEQDKVIAIIGSYGSGVSIAAGETIKNAKIPAIGTSCTNPSVTKDNPYYFRTCYLDSFQGTVMANYAIQNGAKTAAVITQMEDAYSEGLGSFFEKSFEALTGNENAIVSCAQFQTNEQDFSSILSNVKNANPDVIFAPSSVATAPLIISQARAMGFACPIMGGDTWENPAVIEAAGMAAEGIVFSTFFDEDAGAATAEAKKFVAGYKEKLAGTEPIIPAVAALSYDAYIVLLDAVARAGSTNGDAILQALVETTDFQGVTGIINFDENGNAQKNVAVIKVVQNGEFTYLDTVTVAPASD